jgi:hypothetical protein
MNAHANIPLPESLHYLVRARECRSMAARFRVDFARQRMLMAAAEFERIAENARDRELAGGIAELGALVGNLHRADQPA